MHESFSFFGYNVCPHSGSLFLCSTFLVTYSLIHLRVPLSRQYGVFDIPALHGVHSHCGGGASGGEVVSTGPLRLATDDSNDDDDLMDASGEDLDACHGARAEEAAGAKAAGPTPFFGYDTHCTVCST